MSDAIAWLVGVSDSVLDGPNRLRALSGLREMCFQIFGSWALSVVVAASLFSNAAFALPAVIESNIGADAWLRRDDPIVVSFDRLPSRAEGRVVVFVGNTDVTAFVRFVGTELRYEPRAVSLPYGRQHVTVYIVRDEDWQEVARLPLQVLGRLGVRDSDFDVRVDLSVDAQLDEDHSRDAATPERERYAKLNGSAGMSTRLVFGVTEISSKYTTVFGSQRRDALRFFEKGNDASRIDLADYLVELKHENTHVQLGHIRFGSHRHLVSNLDRRGVHVRQAVGSWGDVAGTVMSGRRIVGIDNFSGVQDPDALLAALTMGLTPVDRDRLRVRIETSVLWSRVEEAKSNFNAGQIRDSESSRGVGLNVSGEAWKGRIRVSGSWARSSFKNENDRALFLGFNVAPAKREAADAYYGDLVISLLQNYMLFGNHPVSVRLTSRFEKVEPLYRSLGASVSADQRTARVGLSFDLSGVGLRVDHVWSRDNLDRTQGVLVTRTRDLSLGFVLPVRDLLPEEHRLWSFAPTLDYNFGRTEQQAFNGGVVFAASAIPFQVSTTHTFRANWIFEFLSVAYGFRQSFQDNRQVGRRDADLRSRTHDLSVDFQPFETLGLRFGTSFTHQRDFESGVTQTNHSIDGGVNWRFWPSWTISADASYSVDSDSSNVFESQFNSVNARLAKKFEIRLPKTESRRGRVFLAFNRQSNIFEDKFANFRTRADTWVLTMGASLSLF